MVTIRSHPYQGLDDGLYCSYDYGGLDRVDSHVDLCDLPRSAHEEPKNPRVTDSAPSFWKRLAEAVWG